MYKISKIDKEKDIMKKAKKIINIILYVIIIPTIICSFTFIVKSFLNPNENPDFFGYKSFVIVSKSMEPTIMKKDLIITQKTPIEDIRVNDIISFKDDNTITTHRIIEIIDENGIRKYKTKGDNNVNEDNIKITYNDIEGKYQFKLNGFGPIVHILQSKFTFFSLIIIASLNYWYSYRLNDKKRKRKVKRMQYDKLK